MKAIIVGGGIGGLAAGLALTKTGWQVEVLEQAPEISEIGAGIQISPNGMRALDALGVTSQLEPALFEPDTIDLRMGRSGVQVFSLPMKGYAQSRWGARFVQVHRADLQRVLKTALGKIAGPVFRTDARVTGYVREKDGASVYLGDGSRVHGDLIVGADGIHSAIRTQMAGPDRARFTGNVAWRITAPVKDLGDHAPPPSGCIWAGSRKHAVTTRIRGGKVANFVGVIEMDSWREEGWKIPGDKAEALAEFGNWHPCLRAIIETADQPYRWALHDRPPLAKWSDGPVTLLGDAAHPMLPSMAQGAVQALEDAVVLARKLEKHKDISAALAGYFAARRLRVTQIQQRSSANLRMFHKAGLGKILTYAPIWAAARIAPNFLHARQDWIYGFDPTA